jgi:hypothetical protein
MSGRDHTLIADWEARLKANALGLRILLTLNDRKSELQRCALDGLQRENTQFARAASPEFRKEAIGHCDAIIELMLAIAQTRAAQLGPEPFGFVTAHARRRARQQFPLAGSLNAYRLAHKGYWETIRDSVEVAEAIESEKTDCLMVLSEFLLEFFDRISGIMTDAHIAEERHLIARGARTRAALIEDLLHGRQPGDLDTRALCDRTGIRNDATMAVVIGRVGRGTNGHALDPAQQLEYLAGLFHRALEPSGLASLTDIRKGDVISIIAGGQGTSKHVAQALRGVAADLEGGCGIGVSMDASEISAVPQAFQEAERALEFIGTNRPIMHFGDIDLMEFLVRHPNAAAQRLIPDWAGRLQQADVDKSGALSRTIRRFAACDLNVKRTARDLDLHTNTVYFRLNHVRKLTGVDPRSYLGLSLLLTTLEMLDVRTDARRP